ncbi:hypothetical protein CPC08DRAFT_705191 [Agrocybe pediades]|nr:hypothetical protein CPC08DRAFT_705191 [Agrocybe pediades]
MSKPTVVVFSNLVANMDEWAHRTHIPLTTADALGKTYARAHRWMQALKHQLVRDYHWEEAPSHDPRMLFSIETSSMWRSVNQQPAGPKLRLQLPVHASSFFSSERRVQWEMVFHSDIFANIRKVQPPVNDILHLIQCLLTGLVTIEHEEKLEQGIYKTTRGLPPVAWVTANEAALVDILGQAHFKALRRACSDHATSFKLEVIPHHR